MARPAAPQGSFREVITQPAARTVAGVTLVIMLGYGLIVPVLPLFARSFGVGKAEVGILVTTFGLMRLVFDLVGGPLVDRFGERATATAGAVLVGISSALSAMAPSFLLLVVFRGVGGAGSAIMFAALMNYLVHAVPARQMARTMSMFYASFLLGTVLGQPVGGVIAHVLGLAAPLWFYAGACFISGWLILRRVTDVGGRVEAGSTAGGELAGEAEGPLPSAWGRIKGLMSRRAFVTALAANAAMFWTLAAVRMTLAPLFAQEAIGLSPAGVGGVLGAAAAAQFLVMWKAGSLADSRGRKVVLLPALLILAAATGAVGWTTSALGLGLAMAALGVATGFAGVAPGAIVADIVPRRSGTAIGMYRFAGDVGFVLGPLVAGIVGQAFGFAAAFMALAVPPLLVFWLAVGMPETLRRDQAERSEGG
jgi:MFS transporter, DHA1 family, multidrug resistance protein